MHENLILLDHDEATFSVVDGTFNVVASRSPRMEDFGLEGTLLVNRDDVAAPPIEVYRLHAAPALPVDQPTDLRHLPGWFRPVR
jgi:hypothetical protein